MREVSLAYALAAVLFVLAPATQAGIPPRST
jgi:hypothetical protein